MLIAGPTAGGKSALAAALALRHGGIVINADSAQVYCDLHILTARPSAAEMAGTAHELYGYVDAADAGYSAARWAADAKRVIANTFAVGKLPILVGGTGLYMRVLLDGIAPVPAIKTSVRCAVRALPVADAYVALASEDPVAAAKLNPGDTTRIARALEVVRSTGQPLSAWQTQRKGGIAHHADLGAFVLLPDRAGLDDHIDQRARTMMTSGAIEEVAALLARRDVPADAPILRAIGVAEIAALITGEASVEHTIERLSAATRRYAKRQYTWFRNQPPSTWHRIASTGIADRMKCVEEVSPELRATLPSASAKRLFGSDEN